MLKSKSTRGELSRKYQHIYSLINICMCTLALFFMLFVALSLQAGISPVTFAKDTNEIPSQHVTPCNGNERYPLPTRACIATRDTYPGGRDCKIRNALPLKTPPNQEMTGQRHPLHFVPTTMARSLPRRIFRTDSENR